MNDKMKIRICNLRRGKLLFPSRSETKQQEKKEERRKEHLKLKKKKLKEKEIKKKKYQKIQENKKIVKEFTDNISKNLNNLLGD